MFLWCQCGCGICGGVSTRSVIIEPPLNVKLLELVDKLFARLVVRQYQHVVACLHIRRASIFKLHLYPVGARVSIARWQGAVSFERVKLCEVRQEGWYVKLRARQLEPLDFVLIVVLDGALEVDVLQQHFRRHGGLALAQSKQLVVGHPSERAEDLRSALGSALLAKALSECGRNQPAALMEKLVMEVQQFVQVKVRPKGVAEGRSHGAHDGGMRVSLTS
jgi:hypothetical protein